MVLYFYLCLFNGTNVFAESASRIPPVTTSYTRSLLTKTNEATLKAYLNLETDTDVQAWDTDLDWLAAYLNSYWKTQLAITTLADGGLLVGNATGAIEAVAAGLTTQVLVGGGALTAPVWGTDLPTAVTIGSAYVYRAGGTDVADADVADNITITAGSQIQSGTPTFTAVNLGSATATTLTGSAGVLSVEDKVQNGSGIVFDNRTYANVAAAITAMSTTVCEYHVWDTETLTAGTRTFLATTTVVMHNGGSFAKGAGTAIAFNGPFKSENHLCFSGFNAGDVTFGVGSVNQVIPQWWGENTSPGITDMTLEIQSAINSVSTDVDDYSTVSAMAKVFLPSGKYKTTDTITISNPGIIFEGVSTIGTQIVSTVAGPILHLEQASVNSTDYGDWVVRNLTISGTGTSSATVASTSGIKMTDCSYGNTLIENVWVRNIKGKFIEILRGYTCLINNVQIGYGSYGGACYGIHVTNANAVKIINSKISVLGYNGAAYEVGVGIYADGIDAMTIQSNTIENMNTGIELASGNTGGMALVQANYFEGINAAHSPGGTAPMIIKVGTVAIVYGCNILNNMFTGLAGTIIDLELVKWCRIEGNTSGASQAKVDIHADQGNVYAKSNYNIELLAATAGEWIDLNYTPLYIPARSFYPVTGSPTLTLIGSYVEWLEFPDAVTTDAAVCVSLPPGWPSGVTIGGAVHWASPTASADGVWSFGISVIAEGVDIRAVQKVPAVVCTGATAAYGLAERVINTASWYGTTTTAGPKMIRLDVRRTGGNALDTINDVAGIIGATIYPIYP